VFEMTYFDVVLLFWHAPLGVHSTISRHQPPQRTVLSQINCFVQCEVGTAVTQLTHSVVFKLMGAIRTGFLLDVNL